MFFAAYAIVGGILIQSPFLLVKGCGRPRGDDPRRASRGIRLESSHNAGRDFVQSSRYVTLAQGAGFTVGGFVNIAIGLGYDYAR